MTAQEAHEAMEAGMTVATGPIFAEPDTGLIQEVDDLDETAIVAWDSGVNTRVVLADLIAVSYR